MTTEQRAQLLRVRFRAKGGFPFIGKARKRVNCQPIGKPSRQLVHFGVSLCERRAAWIAKPDQIHAIIPRVKRARGCEAVLTKIATNAPKKLVRLYRNAEALLASRARR